MRTYVLIDSEMGQAGCVAVGLGGKPGILAADTVFGQDDVTAVVEADDIDGLESIVHDEITAVDYVVHTQALLVVPGLAKVKRAQGKGGNCCE